MEQNGIINRKAVYEKACDGCTRHGEELGECCHDEPCERLIFEFTTAEEVEVYTEEDVRNAYQAGYSTGMEQGMEKGKDAAVKHGRWNKWRPPRNMVLIGVEMLYVCSECTAKYVQMSSYCPNCGAKMDGDGNGT